LVLPEGDQHEDDFILLADVFPTGYHATEMADVRPGESVAIYGAGPVGLMAAYSAHLRGAADIYLVDKVGERLDLGRQHAGATPIDFSQGDPVEQILEHTHGVGADKGIDAVGYQAQVPEGADEVPAMVLNNLVHSVRPTGRLGVVGLYLPEDPGAPTEEAGEGRLLFEMGKFFEKGQTMGTGQANVKAYNRHLRDLIVAGRATPSFLVSKRVPLEEAPDAYERFDRREEGYSKVVLDPAA
jgi:glutathione-independent formaldehyde dehydrogenase